jgi:hypothetical protein
MSTSESAENLGLCICSRYNFGRPHKVSAATWRRHLHEAPEAEREDIRLGRLLPEHMVLLSTDPKPALGSSESAANHVTNAPAPSLSARRTIALQELAKRARLGESENCAVGRRKRARISNSEEPSSSNQQREINEDVHADNDFEVDDNLVCFFPLL